ncbi:hypothetical protein K445DRAFT_303580 [Daldinia sp. EC12]|nr:hypothetical protein K445DRAFT_303580 [Daldinia sp. EC12]
MSLHRWSLPSRAFPREKSKDSDPEHHTRFPTIHIGDSISRRRANISSAFANLFEKDENRLDATETGGTRLTGNNSRPLSCIENATSNTRFRLTKRKDGSGGVGKSTLQESGIVSQLSPAQGISLREALQERDASEPPDDHPRTKSPKGKNSDDNDSPTSLTRVRSASSSYPSEGIRSPPNHCHSPQLNPWTKDFIAEITHYGTYPLGNSLSKSSSSTNDTSGLSNRAGKCLMEELAAAGGASDTDTRTASSDHTSKPPLSDVASTSSPRERQAKMPKSNYFNNIFHAAEQATQGVSQGDVGNVLSVLDGQASSTSAIHGSYPELDSSRTSSSEEEFPFRPSRTGSTDPLRQSMETGKERFARKIHWKSQGSIFHTMPASFARDSPWRRRTPVVSPPLGKPLQSKSHFSESDVPSTTFVRRIQKFKFRKWIKKRLQKHRVDGSRNHTDHAKAHSTKGRWKPYKVTKKTRKVSQEKEGIAHRFMNSLKPKHSIHFPIQEKSTADKRRVHSCPP